MNKNQETKEKICSFYANDYHFEMIGLPYMEKSLEEKKEIIILTEDNLEETSKRLIANVILKEEKKKNLMSINWKNDDVYKFNKIKENIQNKKETIIFIKGKENYIEDANKKIDNLTNNTKYIKIINCYNMEEISCNMKEIMGRYQRILFTKGEEKIKNIQ